MGGAPLLKPRQRCRELGELVDLDVSVSEVTAAEAVDALRGVGVAGSR